MRFEHLVQINDPLMPLLDMLTREQLWAGLVLRAEQPREFVLGLDGARIRARSELDGTLQLQRTLDFGTFTVDDEVWLEPLRHTEIRTAATEQWPASRMSITIEEPSPQLLFLRFVYTSDDTTAPGALDDMEQQFRKQAYEQADLDTVARIRELARAGRLG